MNPDEPTNDRFLEALAGEAVEVSCEKCGAFEWVIPLDGRLDENFIANYICDECEKPESQPTS